MSFTLRPYQQQAVAAGLRALGGSCDAGLLVEPTGSGKSLIIANIVKELDAPAVVFQPTKELTLQNAEKMLAYGFTPSIFSASLGQKRIGDITLATIGSVRTQMDRFLGFRYVIYDEADLVNAKGGELSSFLAALGPQARALGMTATPFRLSVDGYGGAKLKFLTRTKPRVFTNVAHYTQIGDLLKQGFLSPLVYHDIPGFNPDALKANTTGADYDDRSVQRYFEASGFRDRTRRVVERLLERGRKHILVFTRFVEEAEVLVETVPGAAVVTGKTPDKERDAVIAAFKTGAIPVVANVGVLTAGFDFPALDTVVLARPSLSLRLYMQMVGRAVRRAPGKQNAWVVDLVGLTKQFGKLEDLELRPGGKTGEQWEFVSRGKPVTNCYYGPKPVLAKQFWRKQAVARW